MDYILTLIEKEKISEIEKMFKEYSSKGVDIVEFVKIFLHVINHSWDESLFLVIALADTF